ncbi:MAG: hypothetical protein PVG66_14140 [Chromatiales bacterium]
MRTLFQPKLIFAALLSLSALTVSTTTFAHQSGDGWQKHSYPSSHGHKYKRDLYKKHRHHKQHRHARHHHRYYTSPRVWERRPDHRAYRPHYYYIPGSSISLHLFSEL